MALASSHGYSVLTRGNIWDKNVLLRARDRPSASPADIAMGFYRALADGNRQERYDAGEVVIFTCLYVGDKEDRLGALKWMNSASGSKIFIDLAGPDAGEEGVEKLQRETMLHLFDLLYKALDQGGEFAGDSRETADARSQLSCMLARISVFEESESSLLSSLKLDRRREKATYDMLLGYIKNPRDSFYAGRPAASLVTRDAFDSILKHVKNITDSDRYGAVTALWSPEPVPYYYLSKLRRSELGNPSDYGAAIKAEYEKRDQISIYNSWAAPHWQAIIWLASLPSSSADMASTPNLKYDAESARFLLDVVFEDALLPPSSENPGSDILRLPPALIGVPMLRMFPSKYTLKWLQILDRMIQRDENGSGWDIKELHLHESALYASLGYAISRQQKADQRITREQLCHLLARYVRRAATLSRNGTLWDGVRCIAILEIHRLAKKYKNGEASSAESILREQISDESPTIVRAAARALGEIIGACWIC